MTHAPRWPAWTLAALFGWLLASGTLVTALVRAAIGSGETRPAGTLLVMLGTLVLVVAGIRFVVDWAGLTLGPEGVGLRAPSPRMAAVTLGFGMTAVVAIALLQTWLGDPVYEPPPELRGDPLLGTQPAAGVDAASLTTVLGRAVVAAVAVEIIVRGYFLPALSRYVGRAVAVGVVVALTSLTEDAEAVRAGAVALGLVLCFMYFECGSILPGVAVNAGAHAYLLGARMDWTAGESLAVALPAAALAYGLALGVARSWDRGPRRS